MTKFLVFVGHHQVDVPALQKIMVEFARENERSELTGELIGDTIDDALADDGDAEAEDKIVSQVRALVLRSGGMFCPTLVSHER